MTAGQPPSFFSSQTCELKTTHRQAESNAHALKSGMSQRMIAPPEG